MRIFETSSNGQITVMDDLRYEAVAANVPEPGTLALLGLGLLGMAARRKTAKA